jgi:hypothetical protein
VPAQLIPVARSAVTNHHSTTGRPIAPDESATRVSIPVGTPTTLLGAFNSP